MGVVVHAAVAQKKEGEGEDDDGEEGGEPDESAFGPFEDPIVDVGWNPFGGGGGGGARLDSVWDAVLFVVGKGCKFEGQLVVIGRDGGRTKDNQQ